MLTIVCAEFLHILKLIKLINDLLNTNKYCSFYILIDITWLFYYWVFTVDLYTKCRLLNFNVILNNCQISRRNSIIILSANMPYIKLIAHVNLSLTTSSNNMGMFGDGLVI